MPISTNGAIVTRLAGALYNQQLSASTYSEVLAAFNSPTALNTLANYLISTDFASKTDLQIATTLVTNLGLSSVAGLNNWVAAQLTAAGTGNKGAKIISMLNDFSNISETDATYGASVTAFNAKVDASQALSQTAGNTGGTFAITGTSDKTFTLTTNADIRTGGIGNDFFDGSLSSTGLQTLTTSDVLNGGAGDDSLSATITGSVTPSSISNIESVSITNTAAATIGLSNVSGMTSFKSQSGTGGLTVTGISKAAAVSVSDTAQSVTFTFSDVAGTTDSQTLTLTNVTGGTQSLAGIETLNIVSSGSANTLTTLTAAQATTVNISGAQDLNLGTSNTVATTVNASGLAGALTLISDAATAVVITGGAGNDVITLTESAATANNVSTGAGNDRVTFTANFTTADTVNGGAGTDTLTAISTDLVTASAATPTTYTVTDVETIAASSAFAAGAAITLANISTTANRLNIGAANAGALTVNFPSGSNTLSNPFALPNNAFTVTAAGTSTTDSLTILNGATSAVDNLAGRALTFTGFETITLNGTTTATQAQTVGAIGVSATATSGLTSQPVTVNYAGNNQITSGAVASSSSGLLTIDASSMTGSNASLQMGTAAPTFSGINGTVNIIGSLGNDVLIGHATVASTISGGLGNDSITGSSAGDSLVGGDGNDTIVGAGGNDTVDAGNGNDTLTMTTAGAISVTGGAGTDSIDLGATLGTTDTVVGGDGNDTLTISAVTTATTGGARVSEFETLTLSGDLTQTMASFTNNPGFTRVNIAGTAPTASVTNALAAVATVGAAAATTAITFSRLTDTTADSLTLSLGDNVTQTAITASGEETITLSNAATAASANSATVTTLSAAALKTLNITGLGGMAVTNAITGATGLTTVVDSHTGTGNLSLNLSNSTGALTFTGGSATGTTTLTLGTGGSTVTVGLGGAATVTGGAGADNITGSNTADNLSGGSGADTLSGGAGDDTLSGGAGNDSISGGDGNDQLSTDSGADTIDGGAGTTDTLNVSSSFTDLSLDTISNVETVVATTAISMSTAQHTAFTTISNVAISLTDAGTVAAKAGNAIYNLANGTNTFTASSTAVNNNVTGGSGADTFNFGQTSASLNVFDANDTVAGGTGTDTLNLNGNIALTVILTNVSTVESIVLGNTTTNVSLTLVAGNTTTSGALTIDGSSLTTGTLTVAGANGGASTNIIGGNAADILTGTAQADTIFGGLGGDSITGGNGIDSIDLTEAVSSIDTVNVSAVIAVANRDVITGFATTVDKVQLGISNTTVNTANGVAAVTATSTTAAGVGGGAYTITTATSTGNDVVILNVQAASVANGDLSTATDGTELLKALTSTAAADTYTGITATSAQDKTYFLAVQGGVSYLYYADSDAGGGANTLFTAAEILLVGTFTGSTLVGGDFVMLT